MNRVDIHAHILPHVFLDQAQTGQVKGVSLTSSGSHMSLFFDGSPHPCTPVFFDADEQLRTMDAQGIWMQAISVAPRLFFYDRPAEWAARLCRLMNEEILNRCAAYPDRFIPVGGLPMQDTSLAIREIEWLAARSVRMIQAGTSVAGAALDEERFFLIYQALEKNGITLLLHPLIERHSLLTTRHHLSNIVGNPCQTTSAAANLIAGGVFDLAPRLQVLLVHGGGFLPYQLGRLDHAFKARPKGEFPCRLLPHAYVRRNLLFDDLTFSPEALDLLLTLAGADRVFHGTDFPYDMAQYDQLDSITDERIMASVAWRNARRLFCL